MLSYLFCILADLYLFSYFPFVVTSVVTGRRVTATPNEGIGAGAKVAIFSQLFVTASTFRVDALVMRLFGSLFSFQVFYFSANKILAAHYQT